VIRLALWALGGILLGGIVHLSSVLVLPRTATQDAYSRLEPITPVNAVAALPVPSPEEKLLPFMDPAFVVAVCRYDLTAAPLKVTTPVGQAYTSLTFYTRRGIAYYAINDRAAGRRTIELDLMTADQRSRLPEDEEVTAADRLIVESPTLTGLVVLRALSPEPSSMPIARGVLAAAQCRPNPPQ
jgi:uncharacterized membrane protein